MTIKDGGLVVVLLFNSLGELQSQGVDVLLILGDGAEEKILKSRGTKHLLVKKLNYLCKVCKNVAIYS